MFRTVPVKFCLVHSRSGEPLLEILVEASSTWPQNQLKQLKRCYNVQ